MDAFIRECGEGHIAVLPHTLQGQLNAQGRVGSFSKVFFIKSISDLWHIMPGLKEALTRAPQPEEMEHILHKINDHRIRLEFRDIRLLSRWLLSYQQELPRYCQIQIALLQSLFLTQIGDAVSAKKALLQIQDRIVTPTEGKTSSASLEQYNHALGADVKIHFAIRSTINAASLCNYEKAMRDMVYFQSEAAHCSPEMRAQYWNVRQMIALLMRDLDAAERFAHNATACAEFGLVAQIPFYRCQHAHLLIARATSTDCPHIRHSLPAQAAALLDAWANMNTARHPVFIVKRQEVFCAYLKSLIAKESRQAWMPPPDVPRDDEYLHAYHYLLFSCVRNPFNTEQDRLDALRKLYREFNNYTNKTNHMSIITIYYHIYALCYIIKCQNNDQCQLHCKRLLEQLHWFRRSNSPGWFDTMAEHVVKVRNQPTMAHMEKLCESLMFPHHLLL